MKPVNNRDSGSSRYIKRELPKKETEHCFVSAPETHLSPGGGGGFISNGPDVFFRVAKVLPVPIQDIW